MLLARFEGVTLAPLAQADDEVEQVLALLGQDVLLIGAAAGRGLGVYSGEPDDSRHPGERRRE